MPEITVRVPKEIEKYSPFLEDFFDGMIFKLFKNSHKDTPSKESLNNIMILLLKEIVEFIEQVEQDRTNENSLIELMDQANFSFLAYVALRMEAMDDKRAG